MAYGRAVSSIRFASELLSLNEALTGACVSKGGKVCRKRIKGPFLLVLSPAEHPRAYRILAIQTHSGTI